MRIKIDYIANARIPTEKAHGLQIMKMCEAWSLGNRVVLYLPNRKNPLGKINPLEFYRIPDGHFDIRKISCLDLMPYIKVLGRLAFWIQNLSFAFNVARKLKNTGADIIFSRDFLSSFILSCSGRKVIYEVHDSPRNTFLKRCALKKIYKFVATNNFKKDELVKIFGIPDWKIFVAPNGVDEMFFVGKNKELSRKALGLPLDKKIVLYSGHLYSWKGAETLLEAAKKLPKEYLTVFVGGTEDDAARFKEKAGENDNILILGYRPYAEIPDYLSSADVLILPNTAKENISLKETSPIKLFEYMASSRPIIASDIPSIREVVSENEVIFFEPDNAEDLKNKIEKVSGDPVYILERVKNAKRMISNYYSWQSRAEKILDFLKGWKEHNFLSGVSEYFNNLTDSDGLIFCKKDRIEHTGKNCYSIIIDAFLYRKTQDEKYFKRAKKRALRTIENLKYVEKEKHYIFYPGSLNGRNASNSVIDSGAAVDSLVCFLENFKEKISLDEKKKIEDAIIKNSDTYLKENCVSKPITNQRLWGTTGLAAAYKLFPGHSDWKDSVLRAIERSFAEQNADGSFQYHPNYKEIGGHRGMADITTHYHAKHVAFIIDSLEKIGEPAEKYSEPLKKATDFLLGMYQPDGVKNIYLEGKRWYWNSPYEVTSHPYDIYVFLKMFELVKDENYLAYAEKAYSRLAENQLKDGGIDTCLIKKDDWQCRIVWNSHVAWLAKVADWDLFLLFKNISPLAKIKFFKNFSDAGVIKYEDEKECFILRYKKKPMNIDWGGAVGGGSLLYWGRAEEGWKNRLSLKLWDKKSDRNFTFKSGKNSLKKFLNDNFTAIKGERWRFFVYFTEGDIFGAFKRFYNEVIKKMQGYGSEYSTAWETNAELLKFSSDEIKIKSFLARRDGKRLEGVSAVRDYKFGVAGLEINDSLDAPPKIKEKIKYYVRDKRI
ncbi:MAG: glycosyltransferase [Patescibacteria group bacterium]